MRLAGVGVAGFLLSLAIVIGGQASAEETWAFTTYSGVPPGGADGVGSAARFYIPYGAAVGPDHSVYIADSGNHTIRKITPAGVVSTFAGLTGKFGSEDGKGSAARFYYPQDVAVDHSGTVYVADAANHTIRKITPDGVVTTLAGKAGSSGGLDGTGAGARFVRPSSVAVDLDGVVYVADAGDETIRRISAAGVVTTVAGMSGQSGATNGTGTAARFNLPMGIEVVPNGSLYIADLGNAVIRRVTPEGYVRTHAGHFGIRGSDDGAGSTARFATPFGVTVDATGNVFVSDPGNLNIRKITSAGVVTTVAGHAGTSGNSDGTGSAARFDNPAGLGADADGNLFVCEYDSYTIRKVTPAGVVTTFAGVSSTGSDDGGTGVARFRHPTDVAVDANGSLVVADLFNQTIRRIAPDGAVTTVAGLAGTPGDANGAGSAARFGAPLKVAVASSGEIYVSDQGNFTIRKIATSGVVTTFAGATGQPGVVDGTGENARFLSPFGMAVDHAGSLFVADTSSNTIRKISPDGVVKTFAGRAGGDSTFDGLGTAARFNRPAGVAIGPDGNIFVTELGGAVIRKVSPAGAVTTLAGLAGERGLDDGVGSAARFFSPVGLGIDPTGNLFVADPEAETIRKVTPAGSVSTIGGTPLNFGWRNGVGSGAEFDTPYGVAVDANGVVYVADFYSNSIRRGVRCTTGAICALNGRFQLTLTATDQRTGTTGAGVPLQQSDIFGYFSIPALTGDARNPEVFVKMLDGNDVNGNFWVFYGGLTDFEYTLTVLDTKTGVATNYTKPGGSSAGGFDVGGGVPTDSCPGEIDVAVQTPVTPAPCTAGSDRLCLNGGRFLVELTAQDPRTGKSGPGVSISQDDLFGYFALPALTGDASNPEVFVKVLDGRPVNGHFWVFLSGLTDVAYRMTVTDTVTGERRTYDKSSGNACGAFDVIAF